MIVSDHWSNFKKEGDSQVDCVFLNLLCLMGFLRWSYIYFYRNWLIACTILYLYHTNTQTQWIEMIEVGYIIHIYKNNCQILYILVLMYHPQVSKICRDKNMMEETFSQELDTPYFPIINSVTERVTAELKQILKKDFNKKMIESTAFKHFEVWWDEQSKKIYKPKEESGQPLQVCITSHTGLELAYCLLSGQGITNSPIWSQKKLRRFTLT